MTTSIALFTLRNKHTNHLAELHNTFDAHLQLFNDLHAVHTPNGLMAPPLASSPSFVSAQGSQPVSPDMAELEDRLNALRTPTHSLRDGFFHTSSWAPPPGRASPGASSPRAGGGGGGAPSSGDSDGRATSSSPAGGEQHKPIDL